MQIQQLGSNQTELTIKGNTILVSYSTPVAACVNGIYYRTERKWSKTTSRHINSWLNGVTAQEKPQEFFDKLVA